MKKWSRIWRKKYKAFPSPEELVLNEEDQEISEPLSTRLQENKEKLEETFKNCSDVVFREIILQDEIKGLLLFIDGMVNSDFIQDDALYPLLHPIHPSVEQNNWHRLDHRIMTISQVSRGSSYKEVVEGVLSGNAVFLANGSDEALLLNVRGGDRRSVEEPQSESAIRGPREGFTENLRSNTALVRFRIKSPYLKMESFVLGKHTKTNVALCYMENLADPKVIDEARNRISRIEIDSVLESGYIEELIEDSPYSPFPQLLHSERADTIAGQLLEGRFAVFVDGTPIVLTGPVTMWQLLQASEDYYERYLISNLLRWLRFLFLFIALFTPAIYVAVTTYHHDMLPTTLLFSVAASREAIPFPAIIEALIMEVSFEALREAGIRLPKTVGQAVSILGALVIGQAAVQAGIVSAPMVIIVSLTGIASFTIPHFNYAISIRILRFPIMLLAATFGLFGIVFGTMLIVIHLCGLRSFGVPYLAGIAPMENTELKDILVRAPWWKMVYRPSSVVKQNKKRMDKGMKPSPDSRRR